MARLIGCGRMLCGLPDVDENNEPDRDAAKIIDTEKMSFHEVKMHMSILDNLISEGNKK